MRILKNYIYRSFENICDVSHIIKDKFISAIILMSLRNRGITGFP